MKSSVKFDFANKNKMTAHGNQDYIFANLCSVKKFVSSPVIEFRS